VIVRTFDGLQALTPAVPLWGSAAGALQLYDHQHAYAEIYRTQPNVRICVDFLARNIAQLGIHVFRRLSDTDRERLADHDLARWLSKPNPSTRRYRLIESLVGDLGVYFNAYWAKVRYRTDDGRPAIGLVRIPANEMQPQGGLLKTGFSWTDATGRAKDFPVSEIVHFDGYNPTNPLMGLSPLETLRRILAEEAAAGDHRESFWRNAARVEGVVTRPKEKPRYKDDQVQSWREQWQAAYAGQGGKTVLLQDGETFTASSWSAKDSEYTAGGKLRREVCAAAYHIPLPLVGILEHATFSNIREQHKHLYQDCLGPWLEMIVQEIEGQLLIECTDQRDVYVEFNIDDKLKGTPEERATSIQMSTGRPWRTVNEARALENLSRIDDPELDTVAPQQGGPAGTAPDAAAPRPPPAPTAPTDAEDTSAFAPVLQAARARQQAQLDKLPPAERPTAFFAAIDRWNLELIEDLTPLVGVTDAARLALTTNVATFAELLAMEIAA
jgi:HK97 family phage portal protein